MREIAEQAKELGICDAWYKRMLGTDSIKKLCHMYFSGDDWAMEKDFPSPEILRKYDTGAYGLHVDYMGLIAGQTKCALLGFSNALFRTHEFSVGTLIVRHSSRVKIEAAEHSFLMVNALDNAIIEVVADPTAQIIVMNYGPNVQVIGNAQVRKTSFINVL